MTAVIPLSRAKAGWIKVAGKHRGGEFGRLAVS
jgi:hypothetical protein